ncbi:hypothetical protein SAMN05880568_0943 [Microbacterium sp. RURRCA19A]|nr:hypothetical protein SAMN05880568_0943 [Microbacterium sp. RURRCA19A]
MRASDLAAPFHGVRSRSLGDDGGSLVDLCRAYAPRLAPGQFFSHETVFALRGLSTPEWPYVPRIHVSTHRPAREPRTDGVVGHRLQTREPAIETGPHGMPMENAVRAWRQCGRLWHLDDLVAGADALLAGRRPLATVDELAVEVALMGDVRRGILRHALALARPGVRSPKETHLRLVLVRGGLPEPEVNADIFSARGEFVAEIDLVFPAWRVAAEYDGRVHAEDPRQFARDADRWAAIRDAGWDHVRILNHHLRDGGGYALTMVRDALIRAGWRPGL